MMIETIILKTLALHYLIWSLPPSNEKSTLLIHSLQTRRLRRLPFRISWLAKVLELRYEPRQTPKPATWTMSSIVSRRWFTNLIYVPLRLCWALYLLLPQVPEQMLRICVRAVPPSPGHSPCCPAVALSVHASTFLSLGFSSPTSWSEFWTRTGKIQLNVTWKNIIFVL